MTRSEKFVEEQCTLTVDAMNIIRGLVSRGCETSSGISAGWLLTDGSAFTIQWTE